ncbi:MAG: hypothetical protein SFV81_16190 [Pirellulaceae bacterium]|nr:hypothetical protein [Pirellulaceae bacterium]
MVRSVALLFCVLLGNLCLTEIATAQTSTRGTVLSQRRIVSGDGTLLLKTVRTFAGPTRIFGDFLDRSGNLIRRDVEFGLPTIAGNQTDPRATGLVNGGYAIAWRNDHLSANGGIRYSVVTTQGAYIDRDQKANIRYSTTLSPTTVVGISNGSFVIAWRDNATGTNWSRSFNSIGIATSGEQRE